MILMAELTEKGKDHTHREYLSEWKGVVHSVWTDDRQEQKVKVRWSPDPEVLGYQNDDEEWGTYTLSQGMISLYIGMPAPPTNPTPATRPWRPVNI